MQRSGFEIALLLGGSFRQLIDELHSDLAKHGFAEARPIHGFALQAIGASGSNATQLAERLGVTKQAAGKTVAKLVALGYVTRSPDSSDARASLIQRTSQGETLLHLSADFFEAKQEQWIQEFGEKGFRDLVVDLEFLAKGATIGDFPGWLG